MPGLAAKSYSPSPFAPVEVMLLGARGRRRYDMFTRIHITDIITSLSLLVFISGPSFSDLAQSLFEYAKCRIRLRPSDYKRRHESQ